MPSGIGRDAAVEPADQAAGWLPGFASALHPGRTGPGEADADRGPGKAPASPPRRRAPRVARGTRGGARAQSRGTDGMTAVVMLLGGGRQRARPRGRRSREDDLARPWWSTAVPPTSRADAPRGSLGVHPGQAASPPAATPAFGGVGRTDGPPHPSRSPARSCRASPRGAPGLRVRRGCRVDALDRGASSPRPVRGPALPPW